MAGLVGLALAGWVSLHGPWESQGAIPDMPRSASLTGEQATVERLRVQVLATYPHDAQAFTQGLVWRDGFLYESDGLYARSMLRKVVPETGEAAQVVMLDPRIFAEGLAAVGDHLIQITWKEQRAPVYDIGTLGQVNEFQYRGEGWGICYDGTRLVMSDGSSHLTFRDPQTFEPTGQVNVILEGQPIDELNELECVGDKVYSNVWQTDRILRIDPASGRVEATIDAAGLLTPQERQQADVLNGIAYDPDDGTFLITGKLWPKLFKVQFPKADGS